MPTYVFKCQGHEEPVSVELTKSIHEQVETPGCPVCEKKMQRVYDVPPVTFQGQGWAARG
jgi:putative FmdB family regulatory protein